MKLSTMLFGAATLVGIGVYVGKKLIEKNNSEENDDPIIIAEKKETYGDKFHKASMFAVGAVKTSADKIAEGFKEIKSADMVKKGEETIEQAKEATVQIKKDIEDLKNMVVSINVSVDRENEGIEEELEEEQEFGEISDIPAEDDAGEPIENINTSDMSDEDFMETGPSSDLNI